MPKSSQKVRQALFTSACLAFAAAALPIACSSKAPEPEPRIDGCANDTECASGTHCQGGACRRNCTSTNNVCMAGQTCGADGRCTTSSTGGTGAGGMSGGGTVGSGGTTIPVPEGGPDTGVDADACASATVDFTVQPPNVMLVVDRSGSMAEELDPVNQPGLQRWQAAREALVNATEGVVPQVQAEVNLGLTLYTAPTGMPPRVGHMNTVGTADPDYIETTTCPFLVQVPIALNNYTAIEAAYRPITMYTDPAAMGQGRLPAGATPTGESVQAVIPVLQALDPVAFPGPKAIVLATDGEPNGCSTNTQQNQGRMNSVAAVQAAFDAQIRTFVISVGDDVGLDHLRELANIGQGFPGNDPMDRFYLATDPAALTAALRAIFDEVRSCTVMVNGEIDVDQAGTGTVKIDGMNITFGDPNGWRVNSPTEIEFLGTACATIQSMGNHKVEISFPCGVIDPF